MEEAKKKLEEAKKEGAVEKQEEAIRELEEARAALEEILRQLREEELKRLLAALQVRFEKMLRLQQIVYNGTRRLDDVPQPARTHNHEIESAQLGAKEMQIVDLAEKALILLREDGSAIAFPEAVGQMRDDMLQVARRLKAARVGQTTQELEKDIIEQLKEMIEALKRMQEEMEERQQQSQPSPSQPQDPALVDLLAEVKLIRSLQLRVNRRTDTYSKLKENEGEQALKQDLIEALDRLSEREKRIAEITHDLDLGKNK